MDRNSISVSLLLDCHVFKKKLGFAGISWVVLLDVEGSGLLDSPPHADPASGVVKREVDGGWGSDPQFLKQEGAAV